MFKRFGESTHLCKGEGCTMRKQCIHFLALIEKKKWLTGKEKYLEECDEALINLPNANRSTDCLFSSKDGWCYKEHIYTCEMECKGCDNFYKKTIK